MKNGVPVLLVGFNRPDFLMDRLKEILSWDPPHIYISIDGPKRDGDQESSKIISQYLNKFKTNENMTIWIHKKNQGISYNATEAIGRVFIKEKNIIVVEDDIKMSKNIYKGISNILLDSQIKKIGIVGGFGAIPSPSNMVFKKFPNRWRTTRYCSLWGWGVRKEIWDLYEVDLSRVDLDKSLSSSRIWNKLSKKQQKIWMSRFHRVQKYPHFTWDTQLQFMCFKYEFKNILPLYRSLDNLGFGDEKSTNTKLPKPKWYVGLTSDSRIESMQNCMVVDKLFEIIDSNSWIGDGFFFRFWTKMKCR